MFGFKLTNIWEIWLPADWKNIVFNWSPDVEPAQCEPRLPQDAGKTTLGFRKTMNNELNGVETNSDIKRVWGNTRSNQQIVGPTHTTKTEPEFEN